MKKFFTLTAVIFTFLAFSCSKSNENNEPTTNPFIGTWKIESFVGDGEVATEDCKMKETIIFKESEIVINSYDPVNGICETDTLTFTYTFSDGKVTNVNKGKTSEVESSFVIVNSKLVVTNTVTSDGAILKTVSTYTRQ